MLNPTRLLSFACVVAILLSKPLLAIDPNKLSNTKGAQEMLTFDIKVLDAKGRPVVDANVTPWAIRSSQGHGVWDEQRKGCGLPATVRTDAEGKATVTYPKYADPEEQIHATNITVNIDHDAHPFLSHEDVVVPAQGLHKTTLPAGAAIDVRIERNGKKERSDNIYAMTTGGRGWVSDYRAKRTDSGDYRILPLAEGDAEFFFVRIEDNVATHFSPIVSVEVDPSAGPLHREVTLLPATTIRGRLSDDVPRPVRNGRLKAQTISAGKSWDEVSWFAWTTVAEDGTFVIDSFPPNEPLQVTALCDGFIGASGEKPPMVSPERARGAYHRPQVFLQPTESEIVVEMTKMVRCEFTVTNSFDKHLSKVNVAANPNVGWWNGGSQIYCYPLVSATQLLTTGKYSTDAVEGIFAKPFFGETDGEGKFVMELPVGRQSIWAFNEKYQLPIQSGRRNMRISIAEEQIGTTVDVRLVMQPKGLDILGDWEDLCGLVFG